MAKKHNKKQNTAFLFECLCKELTKSLVEEDEERAQKVKKILKEHFSEGTILSEELSCYRHLYEAHDMPEDVAKDILKEVRRTYQSLNKGQARRQQSQVINKMNKDLGQDTFNNFIPNYKSLATIDQLFKNSDLEPKEKASFKHQILNEMQSPENKKEETNQEPTDIITFEKFVDKYNEKYGSRLNERQRKTLKHYLARVDDEQESNFTDFLEEELDRIQGEIDDLMIRSKQLQEDSNLRDKIKEVKTIFESVSKESPEKEDIVDILRVQEVVANLKDKE